MTNEELLQQAKDQVAKKEGFESYLKLQDEYYDDRDISGLESVCLSAALLAIQSAREEALKGYKDIIAIEEPDGSYGHDDYQRGLLKGLAEAKELANQAIEKLTAPGR